MVYVEEARVIAPARLWVRFNTGEQGHVDLSDLIANEPAAAPLRDPAVFADFYLDGWPTVAWRCGFDVAPESLHARVLSSMRTG